jgi:hypothetical protein
MTFGEKLIGPTYLATYFTASIEDPEIPTQHIRSSSLRQCMRSAARLDVGRPPDTEINLYQHTNGQMPRLIAKRIVGHRHWTYVLDALF